MWTSGKHKRVQRWSEAYNSIWPKCGRCKRWPAVTVPEIKRLLTETTDKKHLNSLFLLLNNYFDISVYKRASRSASCTDLLLLLVTDLFQQVIPMAGNAECDWALTDTKRIVDACTQFARKNGWTGPHKGSLQHCSMFIKRSKNRLVFCFCHRASFAVTWFDCRWWAVPLAVPFDTVHFPFPLSRLPLRLLLTHNIWEKEK